MHTPLRRTQLIIVDESAEDRLFLQMSLEEYFDLVEASQAQQGLALLRENQIDLAIVRQQHPLLTQQHYFSDFCEILRREHMPVLLVREQESGKLSQDFFAEALVEEVSSIYEQDQFYRLIHHLVNKSQDLKQRLSRRRLQQLSYQHHSLIRRADFVSEFAKQCLYLHNFQSLGKAVAKFAQCLGLSTVLCWRYNSQVQVHHEEPLDNDLSRLLEHPEIYSLSFYVTIGRRCMRGDIIILLRNPPSDKRQLIALDATFEEVLHCCEMCTDQFRLQQILNLQTARLNLISQHFSCGEIQLDKHQYVLDINPQAVEILHHSNALDQHLQSQELQGVAFAGLFNPDDQSEINHALQQSAVVHLQLNFGQLLLSFYPLALPTNPCKTLVLLNEEAVGRAADESSESRDRRLGRAPVLNLPLSNDHIDGVVAQPCPDAMLTDGEPGLDHQPDFSGISVIIVDDIASNRMLIELALADLGCNLLQAENGEEAVMMWRLNKPDAILMDLQMPVLDGYAAAKKIRLEEQRLGDKAIPIIALSAAGLDQALTAVEAAGMNYFLSKPVDTDALVQMLAHYLLTPCNTGVAQQTIGVASIMDKKTVPAENAQITESISADDAAAEIDHDSCHDLAPVAVRSDGLNAVALDKLRRNVGEHYPRVLANFYNDGMAQLQALSLAIAERNLSDLAAAAHAIKGSFSNVGADSLTKRSAQIEREAKCIDDFSRISAAAQMLRSHVEQDLQALKNEM